MSCGLCRLPSSTTLPFQAAEPQGHRTHPHLPSSNSVFLSQSSASLIMDSCKPLSRGRGGGGEDGSQITTSNDYFSCSNSNYAGLPFQVIRDLGSFACSFPSQSVVLTLTSDRLSCSIIGNASSVPRSLLSVNSGDLNF